MAQSIEKLGRKSQRQQQHDCFDRPPSQGQLFWVRSHYRPLDPECRADVATVDRQAEPSGVVCSVLDDLVCVFVRHPKRPEPIRERIRQLRQN